MAEILFNGEGVPLMAFGKTYFATTTGSPEIIRPSRAVEELDQTDNFDGYRISPWGEANDFPVRALEMIGRTGVLNTGLKFIRNFTLGQGVFPVRVTGYDSSGN